MKLGFSITGVHAEPHAAVPTAVFRLRVSEITGAAVHAVVLRCQIRIEARRRSYTPEQQERLGDLFGAPERWAETLQSFQWTNAVVLVPAFEGSVEIDLPVACTYDLEVAAARYFQAVETGEVPLLFLFSGTAFVKTERGFQVEQVPWDRECSYRLPPGFRRELMDHYFPGAGWLRLRRENLEALERFKAQRSLLTWDDTIEALLAGAAALEPQ